MICQSCDYEINNISNFCHNCGASLSTDFKFLEDRQKSEQMSNVHKEPNPVLKYATSFTLNKKDIFVNYTQGIIVGSEKFIHKDINGQFNDGHGHISTSTNREQHIYIKLDTGQEVSLFTENHFHLREGNRIRLYYAFIRGKHDKMKLSSPTYILNLETNERFLWHFPRHILHFPAPTLLVFGIILFALYSYAHAVLLLVLSLGFFIYFLTARMAFNEFCKIIDSKLFY
jgi:hypothetical protein